MYAVVVHHILADILQHAVKLQQSATAAASHQAEDLLLLWVLLTTIAMAQQQGCSAMQW
jgi:hypothetical protein